MSDESDLTATQVKEHLNCSNPKFWDLLNNGEIKGYYLGSQIRVFRESLTDYKERHTFVPRKRVSADDVE